MATLRNSIREEYCEVRVILLKYIPHAAHGARIAIKNFSKTNIKLLQYIIKFNTKLYYLFGGSGSAHI